MIFCFPSSTGKLWDGCSLKLRGSRSVTKKATHWRLALAALIAVLTFFLLLALLAVLAARAGNLTFSLRKKPKEPKP